MAVERRGKIGRGLFALFMAFGLSALLLQACAADAFRPPNRAPPTTTGGAVAPSSAAPEVGRSAPDFALASLDGSIVRLSDYRGKVVIMNFWATWCPPCRAEMPEIEAVYQKYREKGVEVIGVDILEPVDTVRQFVQRGGFSWTFVLDTTGKVTTEYAIAALPTTYFIDREGIIRVVNVGAMTEKSIEARLRELLD